MTQKPMRPGVLYISYTGLLEPLGESQVLQYLVYLAEDHEVTLLTFEKAEALADLERLEPMKGLCAESGITWKWLVYHNKPNLPATLYDVLMGVVQGSLIARRASIDIVHCRSYLAAMMGLAIKRICGARHIFDMRGFWPDERADAGIWSRHSLRYRAFKRIERRLFLGTDHIVSLTRAGSREIEKFEYLSEGRAHVSVIPTCTNLEIFRPAGSTDRSANTCFTLGYVGSAGSWYLFDKVAEAVKLLFQLVPGSRFLVINKGGHTEIRRTLDSLGVDMSRVELKSVAYKGVAAEISRMDAGVSFIRPVWSKRASSPTRLGEFLACGKPLLANAGVGDVKEDLTGTSTGIVIDDFTDAALAAGVASIVAMAREPGISTRCRETAESRFSVQAGVAEYSSIYARLAPADPTDG